MNKLEDNVVKDNEPPAIPNKGVETGVTDNYGGGLDKGYQSPSKIKPEPMNGEIGFC